MQNEKLKVLDLFSGIGGFSLGLERTDGFETVAFCEIEEFPRKVLNKHWPDVPIYEDVRLLNGKEIIDRHGTINLICGGYPCQPFSTAGKRQGTDDDRHLWPEVNRLLDELRPDWFIGENVTGHISMGLDEVLSDLEGKGYTARTFIIPACAVDAPHRRERVWIIASCNDAYTDSQRPHRTRVQQQRDIKPNDREKREPGQVREILAGRRDTTKRSTDNVGNSEVMQCHVGNHYPGEDKGQTSESRGSSGKNSMADTERLLRQQHRAAGRVGRKREPMERHGGRTWIPEPGMGRVANGVPNRVDRLKGLGNAVVPQIPEMIGYAILEAEKQSSVSDIKGTKE